MLTTKGYILIGTVVAVLALGSLSAVSYNQQKEINQLQTGVSQPVTVPVTATAVPTASPSATTAPAKVIYKQVVVPPANAVK